MRKIDAVLQDIPLDELLGGTAMNNDNKANITGIIPDTQPEPELVISEELPEAENVPERKNEEASQPAQIKMRSRFRPVVMAAALALVVGAGGVFLALKSHDFKIGPGAQTQEQQANEDAKTVYIAVANLIADTVADGKPVSDLPKGEITIDLSTYSGGEKWIDLVRESGVKEGKVFIFIDDEYSIRVAQWQSADGSVTEQYPLNGEPVVFGDASSFESDHKELAPAETEEDKLAEAIYYAAINYTNHCVENDAMGMEFTLPTGAEIMLDFDEPGAYADYIYKLKSFSSTPLTGKALIRFDSFEIGFPVLVESQANSDAAIGVFPVTEEDVNNLGEYPSNLGRYVPRNTQNIALNYINSKDNEHGYFGGYSFDAEKDGEWTALTDTIFDWYTELKASGAEPVAYDPAGLSKFPDELMLIQFYRDGESILVRTSDRDGANVYVNGYYYSVDASVVYDGIKDLLGDEFRKDDEELSSIMEEIDSLQAAETEE